MRVSELVEASGVPLPTIKFYLREGLLHPGVPSSRTQASYDDGHVRRIALIRVLTDTVGLSVQRTREILTLIESPDPDLFATLGQAVSILGPGPDPRASADIADYPRAAAAMSRIGQICDPRYPAVAQLERALEAAEVGGIPMTEERLEVYARAMRDIAEYDLSRSPASPQEAVQYSVLGTALYEPVMTALRRLAHQDVAARRLGAREG